VTDCDYETTILTRIGDEGMIFADFDSRRRLEYFFINLTRAKT
jgi:hypothetical protein